MKKYFNTTDESVEQAAIFSQENTAQDNTILGIFQRSKGPMGASDVFKKYPGNILMTSVRRAITVLKNEGFLKETGLRQKSMYGRSEKVWQLVG